MDITSYIILIIYIATTRGAMSLIVEHPLDVVKTYWQANPRLQNAASVITEIYRLKGCFGFYSGLIPNIIRVVSKNTYRYPLILMIPLLYQPWIKSGLYVSILTGLTIALLEVLLITPLERLKVWLITFKRKRDGIKEFFQTRYKSLLLFSYKGFYITTIRQVLSWVTFLVVHDQTILFFKNTLGIQSINFLYLMIISVVEALINTAVILPFDNIKTMIQRVENVDSIKNEIIFIYEKYGIPGFYTAYYIMLIQYIINASFTISLLEFLDSLKTY